jgi:hypothetical protein
VAAIVAVPGQLALLVTRALDDRGREILDLLESEATPPFRWDGRTGARCYWINAQGAPPDGYEAALDRLEPGWREHLSASS